MNVGEDGRNLPGVERRGILTKRQSTLLCGCAAATISLMLAGSVPAMAADTTWDGSSSTDWATDDNWDTGAAPTAADRAILDNGALANQPTIGANATIDQLDVSAGALTNEATFDIIQDVVLSGTGIITSNDTINVGTAFNQTGGTINGNGTVNATDYVLQGGTTGGTINILAGTFSQNGGTVAAGTTVTSAGAQTLQDATIAGALNGGGAINVFAGATSLTGTVTNASSLSVTGGTLNVTGAGSIDTSGNVVTVSAGALVTDGGALAAGENVTVSGTGTFTANGAESINSLAQTGGTINGNGTVNVAGAFNQSGGTTGDTVDINAATFTQSGGATIAAGTTVTSAGAQDLQGGTIAGNLDGAGAITASAGATAISGIISNTAGISVSGGATLTLSGSNTFASNITVADGLLIGSTAGSLGAAIGDIFVTGGTGLSLGGATHTKNDLQISGGAVQNGTLNIVNLQLSGTGSVAGNATLNLTGMATQAGAGSTMDGVVNNATTYTLNDGTFSGNGSGIGTFSQSGGTMSGAVGAGTYNLSGGLVSGTANATDFNQSGGTVSGTVNAPTYVLSGGTLSGNASTTDFNQSAGVVSGTGAITTATYQITGGTMSGSVTASTLLDMQNGVVDGTLNGTAELVKTTAGSVTLSGANTYGGGTRVEAGVLQLAGAGTLGNTVSATTVDGGDLNLGGTSQTQSAVTLNSGVIQNGEMNVATYNQSGGTLQAGTTINATGAFNFTNAGTAAGNLAGAGALTKSGAGLTTLSGTNTFTGGTTVTAGQLSLAGGNALLDTGTVQVSGGSLDLQANETIGSLAGSGNVSLNANTLTTGGNNGSTVYSGVMTGTGGLTKAGTGTMTMTGANSVGNQFTGIVNVNAGRLSVNGTFGDTVGNAAAFNVNAGGTLSGVGTLAGTVSVNNGGIFEAGNSPGTVVVAGNLTLNAGSTSNFELNTPGKIGGGTDPDDNDLVQVGGDLQRGGTLNLTQTGGGQVLSGYYQLYQVTGTIGGAFDTVNAGAATADIYTVGGSQVNALVSTGGQLVQFWDGTDQTGGGAGAQGGAGTWSAANTNWTHDPVNGVINDSWRSQVGVFGNVGGAVTVVGMQSFEGLQFSANDYVLSGDALNMTGNSAGNVNASYIIVDGGVTTRINSAMSGLGLDKEGAGTLILAGTNTYTGLTSVNVGTVAVQGGAAIADAGAVAVAAGATFRVDDAETIGSVGGAGSVVLNADLTTGGNDGTTELSGTLSGAGNLTKTGTGAFTLSNAGNSPGFTGDITVADGTLIGATAGSLGAATGDIFVTGGTGLSLGGATHTKDDLQISGGAVQNGTLNIATLQLSGSGAVIANATLNVAGTATQSGAGSTMAGVVNNATTYTLSDGTFSGNGNGIGTFSQSGGTMSGGVGAGTYNLGGGLLSGTANATDFNQTGGTMSGVVNATTYNMSGGALSGSANTTTFNQSGGVVAGTGTITTTTYQLTGGIMSGSVGATSLLDMQDGSVNGTLSGGAQLVKSTAGLVTLSGSNTFTGGTTVAAGELSLASGNALIDTGPVVVNGGMLRIAVSETIGSLSGTGGSVNINAAQTLTVNQTVAGTFAGSFADTGTLAKSGAATLTLSGDSSAFGGNTSIDQGTLLVTGTHGAGGTTLTVNAGGTLAGTGTIGGNVSMIGGTLSAGPGPGSLRIDGDLTQDAATTALFELGTPNVRNGSDPVTGNDFISVGGTLTLDGTIDLSRPGGGTVSSGYYTLYQAGAITNAGVTSSAGEIYLTTNAPGDRRVNLLIANGDQMVQLWDGTDEFGDDAVGGGAGIWDGTRTNWTIPTGTVNDSWRSQVGVFGGAAGGAVTVVGEQSFEGLQFSANGYTLGGAGTLRMTGDAAGGSPDASFITVDGGFSATIGNDITGAGIGLNKQGNGTLVLTGNNTFDLRTHVMGGTLINQGTLASAVLNDAVFDNSGTVGGGLTNNGTATNSGTINAGVVNNGTFTQTAGAVNGGLANNATVNANGGAINGGVTNNAGATFNVGGVVTSDGNFDNAAGALLAIGAAGNYTIGLDLNNSGNVTVAAGGALTVTGDLNNAATGTVTNDGTVTDDLNNDGLVDNNAVWNGNVATNTGTINNNAGAAWNGNVLSNTTGTITNFATATWMGDANNNGGTLNNAGTWTGDVTNSAGGTFTNTGTLNGSLTNTATANLQGAVTGTIANNAGGTFNLTGNLAYGAFNNNGTFMANAMPGNTATIGGGTFTNAGTISMQNGNVTDNLVVNGNFVGVAGSNLNVDIDLTRDNNVPGGLQLSDILTVNGNLSGEMTVNFALQPGLLTLQENPITVIDVNGTNTSMVTANGLPGAGGIIEYEFRRNGEDWAVFSQVNTAAVGGVLGNISLTQSIIGAVVNRPSSSFVSGLALPDPNQPGTGVWFRGIGGKATGRSTVTTGGAPLPSLASVDLSYAGGQMGVDLGQYNIDDKGLSVTGGVTFGYNAGRTSQIIGTGLGSSLTQAEFNSRFIGAYATVINGAFGADLQARVDMTDFTFNNPTVSLNNATMSSTRYSLNGSASYSFQIAEGTSLVPEAGFSISRTQASPVSFTLPGGGGLIGTLTPLDFNSYVGYAGLTLAHQIIMPDEISALTPFITATIYNDFGDDPRATYTDAATGVSRTVTSTNLKTFGEVSVGLGYLRLFEGTSLRQLDASIRGDFKFGQNLEAIGVNAQLRLSF